MDRKSRPNRKRASREQFGSKKNSEDNAPYERIFFNGNVFNLFLNKYVNNPRARLAYDGRSIAYSPHTHLNRNIMGYNFGISAGRDGQTPTPKEQEKNKETKMKARIDHSKDLKYEGLMKNQIDIKASTEFRAALDNVLANKPTQSHVHIVRLFYVMNGSTDLGEGRYSNPTVRAWRGFYQSYGTSSYGLLLNVDETYSPFGNLVVDLALK